LYEVTAEALEIFGKVETIKVVIFIGRAFVKFPLSEAC